MSFSRRTLARAGVLAIGALTLGACDKTSTAPMNVTPDQLQSMGDAVATEIEGAIAQLTINDVMNTNGGAPTFARVPRSSATMYRGLSFNRYAINRSANDISQCGVPSQNPADDTDHDGVPNNFSVTFALPACHFTDVNGNYDVTGTLRVSDPSLTTAGLDLGFALDNFKLAFSGANGSGYVSRNGSGAVSVNSGGLYQTATWDDAAVLTGIASATDHISWTNTFVVAQGQNITIGQPLPDGAYSPSGSVSLQQGNREASFSVQTITPLAYSATCAAGVANGTSLSPFTGGKVRVSVSNQQNSMSVDVTYSNCNTATVTLAP